MKFPYGLSNFASLIAEGYFYIDRTDRIPLIEDVGKTLLFLRPRRFGKSLLLSIITMSLKWSKRRTVSSQFVGFEFSD